MYRGMGIDVTLGEALKCPFPYQGPHCPEVLFERLQEAQAVALGVDIETRPRIDSGGGEHPRLGLPIAAQDVGLDRLLDLPQRGRIPAQAHARLADRSRASRPPSICWAPEAASSAAMRSACPSSVNNSASGGM